MRWISSMNLKTKTILHNRSSKGKLVIHTRTFFCINYRSWLSGIGVVWMDALCLKDFLEGFDRKKEWCYNWLSSIGTEGSIPVSIG